MTVWDKWARQIKYDDSWKLVVTVGDRWWLQIRYDDSLGEVVGADNIR